MCYHILEPFRRLSYMKVVYVLLILLPMFQPGSLQAAGQPETSEIDYTLLSLEELINIEVISASKKSQKLSDTSAAVYVITQEDIKRSGAQSIPHALRMVPGLQVARIDANKWAITARGFNDRFSNKLLVMVDGRSVYTHLFSGVLWDAQDTMLEDIEQIEVIRGPGATIWGANAVNGVINIITKKASATQGSLLSVGAGSEERFFGAVRYGGQLNSDAYYRIFTKYFDRDGDVEITGMDGNDEWDAYRAGIRLDWNDAVSINGAIFKGDAGGRISNPTLVPPYSQTVEEEILSSGGHLSARFEKSFSDESLISIQLYYDRSDHDLLYVDTAVDTIDFELNHFFHLGSRHEIVWGVGARYIKDDLKTSTPIFQVYDSSRSTIQYSGFVQDEISFFDSRLRIIAGSKFEHNEYTGFELQPNFRISWSPEESYSIWASASRAVRTPSRFDNDLLLTMSTIPEGAFLPFYPGAGFSKVIGKDSQDSEDLTAFEMGLRVRPKDNISVDLAIFYNMYDNIRGGLEQKPFLDMSAEYPAMVIPIVISNVEEGESYGLELAVDWFISEGWKIKGSYAYLDVNLTSKNSQANLNMIKFAEGSSPQHQASMQSMLNLPGGLTFDFWCRYVDDLFSEDIDSYVSTDVRLGWQVSGNLELSIAGQNILGSSRQEFVPQILNTTPTKIQQSVYGKIIWRF